MRGQLVHLIKAASEPHVTLQVIPFGAGAHAGMPGSFILLDFPDPAYPDVVYIDSLAGDLFLEKETELRRYRLLFEHLRAVQEHQVKRRRCLRRGGDAPRRHGRQGLEAPHRQGPSGHAR